ncbi:hypothetical protein L1965_05955 [Paracoccus sp. EGI L200073]|nr:hypothetical protein [Paracoccus salsus]
MACVNRIETDQQRQRAASIIPGSVQEWDKLRPDEVTAVVAFLAAGNVAYMSGSLVEMARAQAVA